MGNRVRSGLGLGASLTAAVVFGVPGGNATPATSGNAPPKLVGHWTRTVTNADLRRAHAVGTLPGLYKLSISKSGAVSISGTAVGQPITGKIVPAGLNRVHINISIVTRNVYSWRVSGRLLTFTKISESPDVFGRDRSAVMWGVWKRVR
jgi:hypothetical protein